jgi:hypothetical protein
MPGIGHTGSLLLKKSRIKRLFCKHINTTIKTTFMKHIFLNTVIASIALFSVSSTMAQKAHGPITSTDQGQTIRVCYDISGLGNVSEVQMTLSYTATVFAECFNPGNRDESVPAHNSVVPSAGETFTAPVRNGRAVGCFNSTTVFSPGSCPNSNWTASVTDVSFSNITLSVLRRTFNVQPQ